MVYTFLITLDGVRRKDILDGPDLKLLDSQNSKSHFFSHFSKSASQNLPFIHHTLIAKGKLYQNLYIKNKYKISYPGYNDLITGNSSSQIKTNEHPVNPHYNYLELLCQKKKVRPEKVSISTSWFKFIDIFNCPRNKFKIINWPTHTKKKKVFQKDIVKLPRYKYKALPRRKDVSEIHHDLLVYSLLLKNIKNESPDFIFLNLGLTDYYGHKNNYYEYWNHLVLADSALENLVKETQKIDKYRDNSVYFITTDHGRGNEPDTFAEHSGDVSGSEESWLIVYGKNIKPGKVTKKTPNTKVFDMLMKY
jgi:hypothetical protein